MSEYSTLRVDIENGVGRILLDRPDAYNAISKQMVIELKQAFGAFAANDAVRVSILGSSSRNFSAGYDLGEADDEISALHAGQGLDFFTDFVMAIWKHPKPVIAAVRGYCLGGACELAMLCDLTIVSDTVRMGEPEIRMGYGSTLIMPWLVPMKAAKELLYSGSMIDAARCHEIGLANAVVGDDALDAEAMRRAKLLAQVPAAAMQLTKQGVNQAYEIQGFRQAIDYHNQMVAVMMATPSPEKQEYDRRSREDGVSAALRWVKERFARYEK